MLSCMYVCMYVYVTIINKIIFIILFIYLVYIKQVALETILSLQGALTHKKVGDPWSTGCCACATERITPRGDSFFPSHIKDSFKMNKSFKNDPSLVFTGTSQLQIMRKLHLSL